MGGFQFAEKIADVLARVDFIVFAALDHRVHEGVVHRRALDSDIAGIAEVHLEFPYALLADVVRHLRINALATDNQTIVEPDADLTNLHRLIALHRRLSPIWIYLYENGMLVRDDLRIHLALTFSRQLAELPVVVPLRPRKTFSLNDHGRICDTDAAPLHNQPRPTGRIPVLFDSLFPFVLKFNFCKGESYFSKGKAEK